MTSFAQAGPLVDYDYSNLIGHQQTAAKQFVQRFGFHASYHYEDIIAAPDIAVESFSGLSLVSDWHPAQGAFRFSAGLFYGDDGHTDAGNALSLPFLDADSGMQSVGGPGISQYLGLGWGMNSIPEGGLDYSLDMGLLHRSDQSEFPQTRTENGLAGDLGRKLGQAGLSPVVTFGVSYSF